MYLVWNKQLKRLHIYLTCRKATQGFPGILVGKHSTEGWLRSLGVTQMLLALPYSPLCTGLMSESLPGLPRLLTDDIEVLLGGPSPVIPLFSREDLRLICPAVGRTVSLGDLGSIPSITVGEIWPLFESLHWTGWNWVFGVLGVSSSGAAVVVVVVGIAVGITVPRSQMLTRTLVAAVWDGNGATCVLCCVFECVFECVDVMVVVAERFFESSMLLFNAFWKWKKWDKNLMSIMKSFPTFIAIWLKVS